MELYIDSAVDCVYDEELHFNLVVLGKFDQNSKRIYCKYRQKGPGKIRFTLFTASGTSVVYYTVVGF